MVWQRLKRWWLLRKLGGPTAQDQILQDYEVLVRLARRCAYDFSHACDYVRLPSYLSDLNYQERARMWIALFAKGNPGKDYRIRQSQQLEEAERAVQELVRLCQVHDIEIPKHIDDMDCLIPF